MKKKISILLLFVFLVSTMLSLPAMASNTVKGFYNIGPAKNAKTGETLEKSIVTITPYAGDSKATKVQATVMGSSCSLFQNSDRMTVSYSAATAGGYYGLIMVKGTDVIPTVDNQIFFIDQITAASNTVDFDVYPILPDETTDLTIYISNNQGEDLVKINLNYAVGATVNAPAYTLGDLNEDGDYDVKDALIVLQVGIGKFNDNPKVDTMKLAADVNFDGDQDVRDALLILQRGVGRINSFEK